MDLKELQHNWDVLGQQDAMWAVLTDPAKKGGKWSAEEFFDTGEKQIESALEFLRAKGIAVKLGCALDFGCGVGRLTQALGRRFAEVHGVDIAPSMVERAQKFNRFPDKIHYHVNSENNLKLFPDAKFDFILTLIVLQHIQGDFVLQYVREFIRTLAPGGVVMFQFIEPGFLRRSAPARLLDVYRAWRRGRAAFVWEFGVSRKAVDRVLREAGARVLLRQENPSQKRWWSDYTYVATRD